MIGFALLFGAMFARGRWVIAGFLSASILLLISAYGGAAVSPFRLIAWLIG